MTNRLRRVFLLLVIVVFFILPFFSNLVKLWTDWWWFQEVGYTVVFLRELKTKVGMFFATALAFLVLVVLNVEIARRFQSRNGEEFYRYLLRYEQLSQVKMFLQRFAFAILLVLALFVGLWGAGHWSVYLQAQQATPFHLSDPLFQSDVSFYVFTLPFYQFIFSFLALSLFIAFVSTGIVYVVEGNVTLSPRGLSLARASRGHLLAFMGGFFLLLAAHFRFEQFYLLFSKRGVVYGAGYADIHAELPLLKLLFVVCVASAAAALIQIFRRGYRWVVLGAGLVAVGVIARAAYPGLVHKFEVAPNEISKERPYIERAIRFTRLAYDIDQIDEKEFPAEESLNGAKLKANELTIKNIRLWDHRPLLATYSQLQEIRTYYDFVDVDNDRYWIDGEYRQVMLSPRELASANLPSRIWINEHLTYTHGYGLCLGPVNRISQEGLPEFFVKDIPPVSTTAIPVTRPEIYFGEVSNEYVFVRTRAKEFDYPSGDENVYSTYSGQAGVPMRGWWRKLLFSLRFGEMKIFLSSEITPESRILFHRKITQRVHEVAPFLHFDEDPYLVVTRDGRLVWMIDGYTSTEHFPYSEPTPHVGNYIRNSVKSTIDAFDGTMNFYVSDPRDPLIQTQMKIFPGLLQPLEAMPEDLRAHIRYPERMFTVQAHMYATYHMTDPQVFYNKEDLWKMPRRAVGGAENVMQPYYTIMRLPFDGSARSAGAAGSPSAPTGKEEFILMIPFTPAKKENLIAWLAARCDAPNYGKMVVYEFPKQKLIYGPQQIESRIDQDPEISKQLTLWNQGGSMVIRGSLLVIPIEQSLLYIQPLYLSAAQGGALPELKRVIVAYGNAIAMEENLEMSLGRIFSGLEWREKPAETAAPAVAMPNWKEWIRQASEAYDRAQKFLREGNFAAYGEEIKKLEAALRKLREQSR